MKARFLLILSVLVNVGLAGVIVYLARSGPASGLDAPASGSEAARRQIGAPATPMSPLVVTNVKSRLFDWRAVESSDYREYIANLRAVGCPEETIRDIIVADVNKLFESRRREITASTNKFEFWKTGNPLAGMVMDPERIEKIQALNQEKRALLEALLGVVPDEKPDLLAGFNPFETMLDFLPTQKQNQVMEVYMKYQSKLAGSFSGGSMDADDMKNMRKVQKELDAELASLMSPQEYNDYQLRMSQTAMMMRTQLGSFEPSEQEFREIFDLRKPFDDEYSVLGLATASSEERERRGAAQKDMNEQLKKLLGDQRYAEYERAQDYTFQSIYRTTEKYDLPKESAVKVFDMKKLAEQEAAKVRADQSLTQEQRAAALQGIRAETENSIQTVLGDKAWGSFQTQPGNYWLRGISPDSN